MSDELRRGRARERQRSAVRRYVGLRVAVGLRGGEVSGRLSPVSSDILTILKGSTGRVLVGDRERSSVRKPVQNPGSVAGAAPKAQVRPRSAQRRARHRPLQSTDGQRDPEIACPPERTR